MIKFSLKGLQITNTPSSSQNPDLEILLEGMGPDDHHHGVGRVKQIWYLSPMRAAKVQASLRIRAVSPESPLLAHTSNESRGTFRQKARSLAPQNGWACAVKICYDGMLEDTNSLDASRVRGNPGYPLKAARNQSKF